MARDRVDARSQHSSATRAGEDHDRLAIANGVRRHFEDRRADLDPRSEAPRLAAFEIEFAVTDGEERDGFRSARGRCGGGNE
jgi:hypothetical protein